MHTLITTVPHGVIFVYDPSIRIDVPEDTGGAPLLATKNCISIWTIGEEDGSTELMLGTNAALASGDLVFDGVLQTGGHKLALNDSACNALLQVETADASTRVRLFANDAKYPTKVCCIFGD